MQGFNMGRYRPYDVDPSKESFNARSGKHPLGKRAHKLDQGVLVVRFELPFNVWCGGCGGHIGQGVRYNAEKSRVGEYYTTPIYRFRCKTACCQHWFEVETDPKNTRYIVVSGAKEQSKEWDPEENGGHPVWDDGKPGPSSSGQPDSDPFSALERAASDKARANAQKSRLEELEEAASARSADPYTLNSKLRSHFRGEKKARLQREAEDEALRKRIGWNADRKLLDAATPLDARKSCAQAWADARDQQAGVGSIYRRDANRGLLKQNNVAKGKTRRIATRPESHSGANSSASALAARMLATSRAKADPFSVKR